MVDEGQRVIFFLDGIIPFHDGCITVFDAQTTQPVWILCTPDKCMKLIGEIMILGVVESPVTSPVVTSSGSLYRTPLGLVLTSDLIPKCIVRCHTTSSFYLSAGRNVTQKLVGIR